MNGRRAVERIALLAATAVGVLTGRTLGTTQPTEAPTYRRLTYERGDVEHARFAPDGNTVVYSAEWRGEPTSVFTMRLDSRESRSLGLGEASLLGVSSKSELAIGFEANDGMTLSRVPLAGGAPREVIDRVACADWSPDGSDLAVVRVQGNSQRVEFPIGKVLYTQQWQYHQFARVAARRLGCLYRSSQHVEMRVLSWVWIATARNGRCPKGGATCIGVAWRPDGREVWFTAGKSGEFKSLRAVTLDGKERLISRMLGQIDLEDIGRDGRVLLTRVNIGIDLRCATSGSDDRAGPHLVWVFRPG